MHSPLYRIVAAELLERIEPEPGPSPDTSKNEWYPFERANSLAAKKRKRKSHHCDFRFQLPFALRKIQSAASLAVRGLVRKTPSSSTPRIFINALF